jgi:hypothetical protein
MPDGIGLTPTLCGAVLAAPAVRADFCACTQMAELDGATASDFVTARVHVAGHGWAHVSDLRVGDRVRTADGTVQSVTALRDRPGLAARSVYDLAIDGLHTFYVRPDGGTPGKCSSTTL